MTDTSAVVTSGVGQPEKAERQDGRTEDKSQEVNTSAEGGGSSASAVEDNRTFNNACSENKQPVKGKGLSVVFPPDSLVLGYMDPPNPWKNAPLCDTGDLLTAYRRGCDINGIKPLTKVLQQIHGIENNKGRFEILSLKGEKIDFRHVESFEELFRRVQFKTLDFEASHLDDESSVALFDMVEYYESTCKLNISFNKNIGVRGWQSCARLIKKTPCLVHLDARNCDLNERVMPIIGRSLKLGSSLTTLHLENTFLSGRALLILVAALKMNEVLQELFLADNKLMPSDAIQLGNLLKFNHSLYLLDLRNNHLQDVGVGHLSDGLYEQNLGKGLNTLVLWNNQITYQGMPALARALGSTESLETLNLGHNNVTNEGIYRLKDGLLKNKSLLRIGLQSTKITCEGAVALAEFIADSRQLLRLDLRENEIKTAGLMALSLALKVNETVTKMDVDKDIKKDSGMKDYADQQKRLQMDITNFLTRNKDLTLQREEEERRQMEERARENTRLREERERQAAVAESSVIEASYIPTCKKISRPSLLFLAECPQQTLDSPGISGTFKFEDWPESLPDNPVTPPVPNQLVSPPPSDLLLSPQYSTRTKARKLFTVCKVGAGGLVSPSIVVQSGLTGSVSGLPDPLPGPSSPVAMLSPTTKQNSSKVRSSITSPTSPINVLSAMQPEFSLPRGEEHLDTTEMAVDNVTTLIHQIVSEAVDMQQKGIDISHGVSAEASDQALQTTIDIVVSEHSDPVLGKVSGTDQPVLLNGFDHSPEDTAGEDVNSKTGVSPANGVVEECKTSETVTSSECRTRSDVTVNNNKAVNSVDSVQRVDGDSSSKDPDLHTNLTLNGMTRELASVLDTLDLSHHQLNNSSNIPLDDATTPDEFERELDAMLASVNGGLPISSVSGSGS